MKVSFFIPAYNCVSTIEEAVKSIVNGNIESGDEIVICNDCSTDDTGKILKQLQQKSPIIKIITHTHNKGGGAARNTAIENTSNPILFCLDSDNILIPGSIKILKEFMLKSGADVVAFQELHYFREGTENVTHKWIFRPGITALADCFAGPVVPVASGNYMFTKKSWSIAGGYPEFAGALDAWGFGFRQLATGSKMVVMPDSYYYHRHGHESYWVRDSKNRNLSLAATQILIPFIDLINDKDVDYILDRKFRYSWFENLKKRHIRLKLSGVGENGRAVDKNGNLLQNNQPSESSLRRKTRSVIMNLLPKTIKYISRKK